jgi:hypothetical protein
MQGIKRHKGNHTEYKLPFTPEHLEKIRHVLNPRSVEDLQIWCAVLVCFFGLLRMCAVSVKSASLWDPKSSVLREDLTLTSTGCILKIGHSKTNQFSEREHSVALPYIRDHPLCPTAALVKFFGLSGNVPMDHPLLTRRCGDVFIHLTQDVLRRRLQDLVKKIGLPVKDFGTHSLRRGGATWLMSCGVPLHTIKSIGDWQSDCVQRYLKPSINDKLKTISKVTPQLHSIN